ncbi:MAG: TIGR04372 family glycosyltransferase [Acidobacteria bacterium]|nr:TIGR04372 family glycosyltransferase [Acidobacteriota bacterium]
MIGRSIAVWPRRVESHAALAALLDQKYAWMITLPNRSAGHAIGVGERALACFRAVLALDPERPDVYQSCAALLFTMGKADESLQTLQRGLDIRRGLAARHELDRLKIRFISPVVATSTIGVMTFLDPYVKAGLLGVRTSDRPVLLVLPGQTIPNPRFLNYWRQYVTVVTDPLAVERLLPLVSDLEDPLNWGMECGKRFLFLSSAASIVFKQWEREKRPPLLTLTTDDYARGSDRLRQMGVPDGAWFVCLHVRESGFKDGGGSQDLFRNSDIDTYLPAMKCIVDRGGWVIRMGNPMMRPLPAMDHVVDYARSEFRSDWMDVFLCAQCRLFINNSSGLGAVAAAFGVPYVLTNFLPTCAVLFQSQDTFIPKLCWSESQQRYLTFEELMAPPVSTAVLQHQYDQLGLRPIENTPEEIEDLIVEALDRLDGVAVDSEGDAERQERFRQLTAACGTLVGLDNTPVNCRIGRDFLRKHAALLPKDDSRPALGSQR